MNLLTLATGDDIARLLPMIEAFHIEDGVDSTPESRRAALELLFSGDVQAALWLIGPSRAPVGYIAISFGFSIEMGGRDAFLDEFYIRPKVRGRGMGSQALHLLLPMLRDMGIKAMHLEVDQANDKAQKIYARSGFEKRDRYCLMTRML